jgi:hypothetical protein
MQAATGRLAFDRNRLNKLLNQQEKNSANDVAAAPAAAPLVNVTKT